MDRTTGTRGSGTAVRTALRRDKGTQRLPVLVPLAVDLDELRPVEVELAVPKPEKSSSGIRLASSPTGEDKGSGTLRPMSRLDRITTDPGICHGQPTARRLRYSVGMLLELLASGMTTEEVLADYPDLEADDLLAALEYGALTAGAQQVIPLRAG